MWRLCLATLLAVLPAANELGEVLCGTSDGDVAANDSLMSSTSE